MISVIVCSRYSIIDSSFHENITNTIGTEYEIICIDNSNNRYSIFQAYNIGISKSKYNILCFVHDDVIFHSSNWGRHVIDVFSQDKDIALIGIAGSTVKTRAPSGWWDCEDQYKEIKIRQRMPDGSLQLWNLSQNMDKISPVVCIDGVFMCYDKKTEVFFNENLTGFHAYDLMFCLDIIKQNKKIVVSKKIDLEHKSLGCLDSKWYKNIFEIHQNFCHQFPLKIKENFELAKQECTNALEFIRGYTMYGCSTSILIYWLHLFLKNPVHGVHLKIIFNIFIRIPLANFYRLVRLMIAF